MSRDVHVGSSCSLHDKRFRPTRGLIRGFFPILRLGWWNASLFETIAYPYVDVRDVDVRWDNGLLPAGYADKLLRCYERYEMLPLLIN